MPMASLSQSVEGFLHRSGKRVNPDGVRELLDLQETDDALPRR